VGEVGGGREEGEGGGGREEGEGGGRGVQKMERNIFFVSNDLFIVSKLSLA
jgi:hypothetical protein